MDKKIWSASGIGLGDCWGTINYVLRQSIANDRIEYVSHYYRKGEKKKRYYNKVYEILNTLDTDGKIQFVDEDPTHKLTWRDIYRVEYFPTKIKWEPNNSKNVCYQFDGKSHKCKNMKSKDEEDQIYNSLKDNGFNPIRLGGRMPLVDCVKELASCEFFIGVESGFAHVSGSVRVPVFMIVNGRTYQGVKDCHENREMILCDDYISAISSIGEYAKNNEYYNEKKVLIK